jgi:hypothetical protein
MQKRSACWRMKSAARRAAGQPASQALPGIQSVNAVSDGPAYTNAKLLT